MKSLRILLASFVLLTSFTAQAETCARVFVTVAAQQAPLQTSKSLNTVCAPANSPLSLDREFRVAFYNVENLFYSTKPKREIHQLGRAIIDINADFMVLVEVENIASMQRLSRENLNDTYESYLIEGNDVRGINVGLFVRKGMSIKVESRTHKELTFFDEISGKTDRLFSRDLPVWIIRDAGTDKVLTVIVGTHAKSMRDEPGDKMGVYRRSAQHAKTAEILKGLQEEFGPQANIVFGGDLNSDVKTSKEIDPIKEVMHDAFEVAEVATPLENRVTYVYSGKKLNQLDGLFVSPGTNVVEAQVYLYKDEKGEPSKTPNSMGDRKKNPSDHSPVYMDIAI